MYSIINISLHWIALPTMKSHWPASHSCTLSIKYLMIGCDYAASYSSFAFSMRNKLLVAGTVTSCLVRTR